jgi:hypothetical protein
LGALDIKAPLGILGYADACITPLFAGPPHDFVADELIKELTFLALPFKVRIIYIQYIFFSQYDL